MGNPFGVVTAAGEDFEIAAQCPVLLGRALKPFRQRLLGIVEAVVCALMLLSGSIAECLAEGVRQVAGRNTHMLMVGWRWFARLLQH